MTRREEAATLAMALPITDGRWLLKARSGGPSVPDEETDAWSGVVPFRVVAGEPEPAPWTVEAGTPVPASVSVSSSGGRAVTAVAEGVEGPRPTRHRCAPPASARGRARPRVRRCARCATCSSTARASGCRTCPRSPGGARGRHHRPGRRPARRPAGRPPAERVAVRRPAGARRRAHGIPSLREDLDELAEAYEGYVGPLKVQVAGPWTLAASLRLTRGERLVADPGAVADLAASLADGIRAHVADVAGSCRAPTSSSSSTSRRCPRSSRARCPRPRASAGCVPSTRRSRRGLEAVLAAHDGPTVVHCCHRRRRCRCCGPPARARSALDLTAATPARWESVAATLDGGTGLYAGCLPTDGSGTDTAARALVLEGSSAPGWRPTRCAGSSSPACGLAGLTPEGARDVLRSALDTARRLGEEVGS